MSHSRLPLVLSLLFFHVACDQKPKEPTPAAGPLKVLPVPQPPAALAAPEIKLDSAVYSASSEDHWAQIEGEPGWTYEWSLDGGRFTTGVTANTVRFIAGDAGKMIVRCKIADRAGRETTATLTQTIVPLPVIGAFEATPPAITLGEAAALRWEVQEFESISLSPGSQDIQKLATLKIQPTETTDYVLSAVNRAGSKVEKRLQVKVVPRPSILSFSGEGASKPGQPMTLKAEFADGKAEIKMGATVLASSTESPLRIQVNPVQGTVYTLVVTNEAGATATMPASVAFQAPKK